MKIEINNGVASVFTPYNKEFVGRIHNVSKSKWNASKKCWDVPECAVDDVREIMRDVFGSSDIDANDTITLRVTFNESYCETRDDVTLFGKTLSHAYGRDSGARTGDDVTLVSGKVFSDGSARNWESAVGEGSVFMLYNVNSIIYDRDKENLPKYMNVTIEKVEEGKIDKQKLTEERDRLLRRIDEINKLLSA